MQATDELIANETMRSLVAGWNGRVSAALVYDGSLDVVVPTALGMPSANQMQGTTVERVIEVAGRTCYDSLGKGRGSVEYHAHLLDVKHWSVHEHTHHTIEVKVEGWLPDHLPGLLNRPGVWVRMLPPNRLRITLDSRCILEWEKWLLESLEIEPEPEKSSLERPYGHALATSEVLRGGLALGYLIRRAVEDLAPTIYRSEHARTKVELFKAYEELPQDELLATAHVESVEVVEPETPREEWVTLYLSGSRGWSHELVRHGDWTAISQRSTRYVDESEGAWVLHPLIGAFLADVDQHGQALVREACERVITHARTGYDLIRGQLEAWLLPRLKAKADPYAAQTARKQARGAARGLLGNALETEVIFSFSVAQGLHMLNMRAADAADAEIRMGFAMAALPQLLRSRYAKRFAHLELAHASDGLGMALSGGGHK